MGFPLSVGAWSERLATDTALSPDQQMQMSPVEVSRYYADQLIWYDALSILGDALIQGAGDRTDIEAAWDELLELLSVQRDELTDESLIDCCAEE